MPDKIRYLKPFRNTTISWCIKSVLILMGIFLPIILWPSNPLEIPGREEFASGYIAAFLALLAFFKLMQLIPKAFKTLWYEGALSALPAASQEESEGANLKTEQPGYKERLEMEYRSHIDQVEGSLNHKNQWWVVVLFTAIVLWWYIHLWGDKIFTITILTLGLFAEVLIGIILGLMAWRMWTIGQEISKIPSQYKINILLDHPDNCGGLSTIGNICLWNALIIAVAGIHFGLWNILIPDYPFTSLIFVPLILSIVAFFVPMVKIHNVMAEEKQKLLVQVDDLSYRISKMNPKLIGNLDSMELEESKHLIKQIEFRNKLYKLSHELPTWPINRSIFKKLLAAEALPLLSIIGIPTSIIDILTSVFNFL